MKWATILPLLCACEFGEAYYLEPAVWAQHAMVDGSTGAQVEGDSINAGVTLKRYKSKVEIDNLTPLLMAMNRHTPLVLRDQPTVPAPPDDKLSDQIEAGGAALRDVGPWGAIALTGMACAAAYYFTRKKGKTDGA